MLALKHYSHLLKDIECAFIFEIKPSTFFAVC